MLVELIESNLITSIGSISPISPINSLNQLNHFNHSNLMYIMYLLKGVILSSCCTRQAQPPQFSAGSHQISHLLYQMPLIPVQLVKPNLHHLPSCHCLI